MSRLRRLLLAVVMAVVAIVPAAGQRSGYPVEEFTARRARLVQGLDRGLVVWPNYGNADGENGDLVMLAPPFVVVEKEIDEVVQRLSDALDAVAKTIAVRRSP